MTDAPVASTWGLLTIRQTMHVFFVNVSERLSRLAYETMHAMTAYPAREPHLTKEN